jgi:molybdopterin synthase catalytic subunit
MIDTAHQRFDIFGARVIRVGLLRPLDQIVWWPLPRPTRVRVWACEFLMDYLKTQAPFWKEGKRQTVRTGWMPA